MEDVKTFLRLRGRGSSSLRRLPAFSPVPPNVPSSAKFLCLGLGSGAHSPIFSMVWLKWGVVRDAIRPTLGPATNLRMGRHCLSHPEGSSQQQVSPCQLQTQQPCSLDWE